MRHDKIKNKKFGEKKYIMHMSKVNDYTHQLDTYIHTFYTTTKINSTIGVGI